MLNHAHLARVDINLLVVFDLLFEERNAGRVAAKLSLTPSAVSHALRRLRSTLDDPLFLPTRTGMVPTQHAEALAPAIRDIIERVESVFGEAQRFDPATAVRRFRIGAPDGAISVVVPRLVDQLERTAPGIDLAVLQLLPSAGSTDGDHAWREALADVATGRIDLAILPHRPTDVRYRSEALYSEDFVFVRRAGHRLTKTGSIESIVGARHVLVSSTGNASGFVDRVLGERGYERRIALTVPNFFMAVAAIAASDLIGAIPRRFATVAAHAFEIEIFEPPFLLGSADLNAVASRAAMLDIGVAWMFDTLQECTSNWSSSNR